MKKSTKIILSIIIITLTIALCFTTYLFLYARKTSNENVQKVLEAADKLYELNLKIAELEEKLENTTIISTVTNTTSTYTPIGVTIANEITEDNTTVDIKTVNRDTSLVTLEIDEDTLNREGVALIITDNNEKSYGWGPGYSLQKKENNNWVDLEPNEPMIVYDIAYMLDENNQYKYKIDWSKYYGKLENGTYRIKKNVYDNGYIDLYSNEFEMK